MVHRHGASEMNPASTASKVLEELTLVPSGAVLARTPLFLTAVARMRERTGKLPAKRSQLYWELLDALMHRRPGNPMDTDNDEAISRLAYVAYMMVREKKSRIYDYEFIAWNDAFRQRHQRDSRVSSGAFLRWVLQRTDLMFEVGSVVGKGRPRHIIEFRHRVLLDYLAALAISDLGAPGTTDSTLGLLSCGQGDTVAA